MEKRGKKSETLHLPPQAVDIERSVLGALLTSWERVSHLVAGWIRRSEYFYLDNHRVIHQAIMRCAERRDAVNMLLVYEELTAMGAIDQVGGLPYLMEVSEQFSSVGSIESQCVVIVEKYMLRELIQLGSRMQQEAFDPGSDVLELIDDYRLRFAQIEAATAVGKDKTWSQLLKEVVDDVDRLSTRKSEISGVDTGFRALNEHTGGWQLGELIVIGARPGMGKTAFAVATLVNAAKAKIPGVFVSYEMRDVALAKRVIAVEAETLHSRQLYREGMRKPEYAKEFLDTVGRIETLPITVVDWMPHMTQLEVLLRKLKQEKRCGIVVVDYLQLVDYDSRGRRNGNREQDVSQISRALKKLTLELQVPIIALSQLSREVEKRTDRRPRLSDLRESGALEQDADMVAFLYREDYYKDVPEHRRGVAEFDIAKQRNGALEVVELHFDANRVKYSDLPEKLAGKKEELLPGSETDPF